MSGPTRMNLFLQRMLRRSEEELNIAVDASSPFVEKPAAAAAAASETSRPGFTKSSWIKKLGNYSPNKYKLPSSPPRMNSTRGFGDESGFSASHESTPKRTPGTPEMPDLETIIREFEMGFLSPTKQEAALDSSKQRNFVKKIVAAFEVKYKAYNDQKTERESRLFEEETIRAGGPTSAWAHRSPNKRTSGVFGSPFKLERIERQSLDADDEAEVEVEIDVESSVSKEDHRDEEKRERIFSSSRADVSEEPSERRPQVFSSPLGRAKTASDRTNRRSGIYASPVDLGPRQHSETLAGSYNAFGTFKLEVEGSTSFSRSNATFGTFKAPFFDETIDIVDGADLDATLPEPEETILLEANAFASTNDRMNEGKSADKTPKIVGAFLKKPIEVEETSIDWIPITGKKLPRKRSLKKLLSVLTGKKSFEKKNRVLFHSDRNLNDEPRELQDSGYDEKSCSSSSLTSLVSITEALLQQENSYVEPKRRTTLKTFRSRDSLDRDVTREDEAFYESSPGKINERKLCLTEVPRETLKLDLGPAYPLPSKIFTMSLDRRLSSPSRPIGQPPSSEVSRVARIPKHPFLSKIPKHPFVALTKMDDDDGRVDESSQCARETPESLEAPEEEAQDSGEPSTREPLEFSKKIRNDLYEVEFRRSCEDFPASVSYRSSSSDGSAYDVPRRYLSKSETEIPVACMSGRERDATHREPVYDVPRSRIVERPRSSLYEDALSLKRRSAHLAAIGAPDFYAFPNDAEPHYATVKPRNRRIYLTGDTLRSFTDSSQTGKTFSI